MRGLSAKRNTNKSASGETRLFHHIHIRDVFPIELTVYASSKLRVVSKSSITGKAIERASLAELEQLLEQAYPELDLATAADEAAHQVDRFQVFEALLAAAGECEAATQVPPRRRCVVSYAASVSVGARRIAL